MIRKILDFIFMTFFFTMTLVVGYLPWYWLGIIPSLSWYSLVLVGLLQTIIFRWIGKFTHKPNQPTLTAVRKSIRK